MSLLFSLRCGTFKNVKNYFGKKENCSLGCLTLEDQEHWLICDKTTTNMNTEVEYNYLFGTLTQQIKIVKILSQLEEERKELAESASPSSPVAACIGPRLSPGPWSLACVQFVHFVRDRIKIYVCPINKAMLLEPHLYCRGVATNTFMKTIHTLCSIWKHGTIYLPPWTLYVSYQPC